MKLLKSTENEITKNKNGENVRHLETTEVVLVQCNIVNNDYQQDAYILVKGTITVTNTAAVDADANNADEILIFKNCAPFINCISGINNT